MALTVRGIDIMGWTKDFLRDNFSQAQIEAHVEALVRDFPAITHIAIAVPMNTQAEATTEAVTAFSSEPAAYAKLFMDAIHAEGKKVIFRGTDCYFEGIYDFPKVGKSNGNRFITTGESITDDFSSSATRDHGYEMSSAAANTSTNYLTSHYSGNTWTITGNELVGPGADGWKRTCYFDASNMEDVVFTAKVKSTGSNNLQIIARGSTDSNFPGYGLQMRGSNTLRIERWGIANLGEVTNKTFTNGTYYWLKLECTGTTIRGRVWEDGDAEPGTWDVSVTDSNYARGYCGFSSESSSPTIAEMTITPSVSTDTWMYRAYNWVTTNIADFSTGDMVVPYPEASGHQALTTNGSYNEFFIDLDYCLRKAGTDNSKTFTANAYGHLFTAVLQNAYNAQFTEFGIATYDHYGTALGVGKRWKNGDSSTQQTNISGTDVYSVPTSITEASTHRNDFIPDKSAYNESIDVYIVDKGTGDWTMTLHDSGNNPTVMPDNQDITSTSNSYQATITNANLTSGAYNTFSVDWWNQNTDQTYHFHLTSTVADGEVRVLSGNSEDLNTVAYTQYKGNASPDAMEIDIRNAYAKTGVPQFLQEWVDYWSTNASLSDPVRNQTDHEAYLDAMVAAWQRLVDEGILTGYNYWRALDGQESIVALSSGVSLPNNSALTSVDTYSRNYEGDIINDFFNANLTTGSVRAAASRSASSGKTASSSRTAASGRTIAV